MAVLENNSEAPWGCVARNARSNSRGVVYFACLSGRSRLSPGQMSTPASELPFRRSSLFFPNSLLLSFRNSSLPFLSLPPPHWIALLVPPSPPPIPFHLFHLFKAATLRNVVRSGLCRPQKRGGDRVGILDGASHGGSQRYCAFLCRGKPRKGRREPKEPGGQLKC